MGWQDRHETGWALHLWAHGYPTDTEFWGTLLDLKTGRVGYGLRAPVGSERDHTQWKWAEWLETLGYDCG